MKKVVGFCLFSMSIFALSLGHSVAQDIEMKADIKPKAPKQSYVNGIEDLPLYKGFEMVPDQHLAYDTTDGRIVEADFIGEGIDEGEVFEFYSHTLPQLGWEVVSEGTFHRDGELLSLDMENLPVTAGLRLKIQLQPDLE